MTSGSETSRTTTSRACLSEAAAAAASDKQARDVVVLDVSEPLVICDYFVICSGSNEREAHWILLDFIDVVVHVFHQEEREYYDLERLWRDAPVVARSNELGSLVTA